MTWTTVADRVRVWDMPSLQLSEFKAQLSEVMNRVSTLHERVTITVHGGPTAVLIAVDDLESLEETIAVLSDADLMRQLRKSETERAVGLMESAEDLDRAMQARRARGV